MSTTLVNLRKTIDAGLVRYDGWFLVLIAVLLTLAFTLLAGMAIWCVVNQGKAFTGNWYYENGWSVQLECK